jgi:hypothetical protein
VSILRSRIVGEDYLKMAGTHPAGTPDTPMVNHLATVTYAANQVLYGTLHPLVTADGATVPASADVTYPAVVAAGSP